MGDQRLVFLICSHRRNLWKCSAFRSVGSFDVCSPCTQYPYTHTTIYFITRSRATATDLPARHPLRQRLNTRGFCRWPRRADIADVDQVLGWTARYQNDRTPPPYRRRPKHIRGEDRHHPNAWPHTDERRTEPQSFRSSISDNFRQGPFRSLPTSQS